MAFTAREVILTFRGQNYLSSAIRRVGRDVGALSKRQQLTQAVQQNAINMRRLQTQREILQNEQMSIRNGSRQFTNQLRMLGLKDKEIRLNQTLRSQSLMQLGNIEQQMASRTKLEQMREAAQARGMKPLGLAPYKQLGLSAQEQASLENAYAQEAQKAVQKRSLKTLPPRYTKGLSPTQLTRAYTEELIQQQRQIGMFDLRDEKMLRYSDLLANTSVESRKVAAQTMEMYNRYKIAGDQIDTNTLAMEKQLLVERQLAIQMKAMPWERWTQGALAVEHAGRVMSMAGLIGTAAMGFMAKQAADFQTQMTIAATQIVTVGNNSVRNVQKVGAAAGNSLQKFITAGKAVATPTELTQGLYDIYSGVTLKGSQAQQVQKGISLLKQFNTVYQANYGMTNFNDIVKAGIVLINDFGIKLKDMPRALNEMQAAVRFGRMTMGEFVSTFSQAAPAAKNAGISFNSMADSIAFLSRKFPSIRFAATGYARLVEVLQRNALAFKGVGVQVDYANGKMRPLDKIFEQLDKRFKGLRTGAVDLGAVFKQITGSTATFQARRAGVFLAQDPEGYHNLARQIEKDHGELVRSAIAAGRSTGVMWAKFTNQLRGLVLLLGEGAIPVFNALIRPIAAIVKWFGQLSPHWQHLIGYITAAAAAGTLFLGVLLQIGGGFVALILRMRILAGISREGRGFFGLGFAAQTAEAQVAALNTELLTTSELVARPGGGFFPHSGQMGREGEGLIVPRGARARARRFVRPRPAEERGAIGAGVGAVAAMALLPLATQVPVLDKIINKLGGIKTIMIQIGIIWAYIWLKNNAWEAIKAIGTVITGLISRIAAMVSAWVTGMATVEATATEAGATIAAAEAAATLGLSLVVAGLAFAAAYAITHWQKAKAWFGVFWRYFKAVGIAALEAIKVYYQAIAYGIVYSFTFALRMILKAASYLPFVGHAAKRALDAIDGALSKLKPDIHDVTNAFAGLGRTAGRVGFGMSAAFGRLDSELKGMFKRAKELSDLRKKTEQEAFHHRVRQARSTLQQDPSIVAEVRQLQRLHQQAVVSPDLAKRYALETRYLDMKTRAEAGMTKSQKTAFEQLLKSYIPSQRVASRSVQDWIKLLVAAKRQADKHPFNIQAQERYAQLQRQLNSAFKNQPDLLAAINSVLGQYDQNLQSAANSGKNAVVTMQQMQQAGEQLYQSLLQQNQQNFGQLFAGPFVQSPRIQNFLQYGGRLTGHMLQRDLRSQMVQFRNFNNLLDNLRRRGAPSELINQLAAMGPQAIQQIRALTRMSGPELRKYFNTFGQAQKMIHRQTMRDLNRQLHDYLKYGRRVGLAMAAGIRQESPAISKAIRHAVLSVFGHLPRSAGGGGTGGGRRRGGHRGGDYHHHDHIHVTTTHDNIDAKVRKARFHQRQRHNHPSLNPDRGG